MCWYLNPGSPPSSAPQSSYCLSRRPFPSPSFLLPSHQRAWQLESVLQVAGKIIGKLVWGKFSSRTLFSEVSLELGSVSLWNTWIPLRHFAFQLSFLFVQCPASLECFPCSSLQTSSMHCLLSFVQEERKAPRRGMLDWRGTSACYLRSGTCASNPVLSREPFHWGGALASQARKCVLPFVFASTRKFFSKLYWALHQHSTSSAPSRLCAVLQGHGAVSNVFFALEEPGDPMRDVELFTFFPYLGRHLSVSSISKAFLNVRCADACPTVMGTELWGRLKAWAHVDSASLGILNGWVLE